MSSMSDKVTGLYICHWSLLDPLFQSQSLAYLRGLTREGHTFAVLTFEQPKYKLNPAAEAAMQRELQNEGIHWYSVNYKKGLSIGSKLGNLVSSVYVALRAAVRHRPKIIHSRGSGNAGLALLVSRLVRARFLYDADSVLSEEYVDIAHWARGSLGFRFTAAMEQLARKKATSVIFLTEVLRQDLAQTIDADTLVTVIPCCVDTSAFAFSAEKRAIRRRELGLGDEKLFVYVGKIGGWYEVAETFAFFKLAKKELGDARLLIVSEEPAGNFEAIAREEGVALSDFYVKSSSYQNVSEWLSAADVGLAFIRSVASKRGSSPVKVGEYLSVGLPVVMTSGIGDYSKWIAEDRLGVIIDKHNSSSYLQGIKILRELWEEGTALRERCWRAAEARVSLENVGRVRYKQVYREMLSGASSTVDLSSANNSPALTKRS